LPILRNLQKGFHDSYAGIYLVSDEALMLTTEVGKDMLSIAAFDLMRSFAINILITVE
jgi:hypothetical protein